MSGGRFPWSPSGPPGALAGGRLWTRRDAWTRAARTVAAYRDRCKITDDRSPFGPAPVSTSQKIDAARARAALNRAQSIATDDQTREQVRPSAVTRPAPRL